ncbi:MULTISPECIES: hypothetical protein [Pectobacterium]|uniref:hypothetical protein n=1 Tax=Pectobacterium TaxID=122277 RepID=UPI000EB2EE1C|nr:MULTISPECIES: hypothetical protein [Pectobacterium]AYH07344.1 hypothetical protein C5E25_19250 [Pectobacterium parmentieri]
MSNIKKYIPESTSWLRAVVASIPMAGSALDHLLFDKADFIRMRNMEAAVAALSDEVQKLGQQAIDKDWFSSEEALAAFKILSDKASYEPDKAKVDALGRLVATCGTVEHASDAKKLSVLEHLARLTSVQIKLLSVMLSIPPQEKKFSTGSLEQTAKAIWLSDVVAALKVGPQFWIGQLVVDQELEVLESLNTIRRVQLLVPGELGFIFTAIGRHAATYVKSAGL